MELEDIIETDILDYSGLFRNEAVYPNEDEADRAIHSQGVYWQNLINILSSTLRNFRDENAANAISSTVPLIQNPGTFIRKYASERSGFLVKGRLPLTRPVPAHLSVRIQTNPYAFLAVLLREGGDFCNLVVQANGNREEALLYLMGPRTHLALLDNVRDQVSRELGSTLIEEVETQLATSDELLRQQQVEADKVVQEVKAAQSELTALSDHFRDEVTKTKEAQSEFINEFFTRSKEEWSKFIDTAQGDVSAAVAQARETKALKGARQVWAEQIMGHREAFRWSFGIFCFLIVIFVAAMIYWWADIYEAIPKDEHKIIIASALVVFVFPLVGIAWILRIISRIATSAVALREDAEHRRAMIETYFQLVGDPEAKMEAGDRILILNAIFRPLPGHQGNDVAPPTLFDMAKDALGGNKP